MQTTDNQSADGQSVASGPPPLAAEDSRKQESPAAGSLSVVGDGEVLDHLERLLKNYPHALIQFNDDPDVEDTYGLLPLGFSIRMDGCAGLWSVSGPTLRAALIADMLEEERDLRRMGGTAEKGA